MKKILSVLVLLSFIFGLFSFTFNSINAQTLTGYTSTYTQPTQTVVQNDPRCLYLKNNMQFGARDTYTGAEVSKLQSFLVTKGYLNMVTGYFGSGTRSAVTLYQKEKGLYQTGYVGSMTRGAIYSESCSYVPTPTPIPTPSPLPVPTPTPIPTPVPTPIPTPLPTPTYTFYCSINGQTYNTVFDYNSYCTYQQPSYNQYFCSLNGITYYDVYSYSTGCVNNTPTSSYYCSINGQTYYNYQSYQTGCVMNPPVLPSYTVCPTSGSFGSLQYPNCTCPSGYNKISVPTYVYDPVTGPLYECQSNQQPISNICPINTQMTYAQGVTNFCTCPSGTTQVNNPTGNGTVSFQCTQ